MQSAIKYVYKRVKMKNITIFLSFCWVLWFSQIFAISTLLTRTPDVHQTVPVLTLREPSQDIHIEAQLDKTIDTLIGEESNRTASTSDEASPKAPGVLEATKKEVPAASAETHVQNDFIILSDDTKPVEASIPTETGNVSQSNEEKVAIDLNLTVDENQIPVFSEWAQKRLEEAEKLVEQEVVNSSTMKRNASTAHKPTVTTKLRSAKNYASPDCGAKIIAANSESSGVGNVLTLTKDEYLLSPCKNRIWFVVELCEAIQAEYIHLANFELFSSSPKKFSVSVSNRFPTRDWTNVGKFEAKDERYVQNFDLHPHLFGKYVRVDIHSHYNSEHFCPISLFRVYGTSEFEAFETENRQHPIDDHDDDDGDDEGEQTESGKGIFKSASDAVMSIVDSVKKAASFVKPNGNKTAATDGSSIARDSSGERCVTPNFVISCEKCSDEQAVQVSDLLKCKQQSLNRLLGIDLIKRSISQSQLCANSVGLDLANVSCDQNGSVTIGRSSNPPKDYVSHLFPLNYIAALCNFLAAADRRIPFNGGGTPDGGDALTNVTIEKKIGPDISMTKNKEKPEFVAPEVIPSLEESISKENSQNENKATTESVTSEEKIDGTEAGVVEKPAEETSTATSASSASSTLPTEAPLDASNAEERADAEKPLQNQNIFNVDDTSAEAEMTNSSEGATSAEQIDLNIQNWNAIDEAIAITETTTVPNDIVESAEEPLAWTTQPHIDKKLHSESVFLRLSNRVKALERNMSLSAQYLEELSRRYKKQVEELQSSFAKTLLNIEEQNRRSSERKQELLEQNQKLRSDLEVLTERVFSWKTILICCCTFVSVQVLVFSVILKLYTAKFLRITPTDTRVDTKTAKKPQTNTQPKLRRKSAEEKRQVVSSRAAEIQRRPSTEALHISGTYEELLIKETDSVENLCSEFEDYDKFEDAAKRKSKNRARKSGAAPSDASAAQNEFVRIEDLKQMYAKPQEDYEMYGNSELSFNELTSSQNDLAADESESNTTGSQTIPTEAGRNATALSSSSSSSGKVKKIKSRRLSSPTFFKAPFSGSRKAKNETTTGWEWHRPKKLLNNSSQNNNNNISRKLIKKSKSLSPESVSHNGVNGRGSDNSPTPSSLSQNSKVCLRKSSDSISIRSTTTSSLDESIDNKKPGGSFRRFLKKLF